MNKVNKKYIAVAVVFLLVAVIFTACKKKEYDKTPVTETRSTVAFDENATITTDENGDPYITNLYGDKIPVTEDEDGFFDDISTMFTQTTTQKDKGNSSSNNSNTEKPSDSKKPTTKPTTNSTESSKPTQSDSSSGKLEFGSKPGNQDTIQWGDIATGKRS